MSLNFVLKLKVLFCNRECNEMGGTCKGTVNKIMYAWAMDAPALTLPDSKLFDGQIQILNLLLTVIHLCEVTLFEN